MDNHDLFAQTVQSLIMSQFVVLNSNLIERVGQNPDKPIEPEPTHSTTPDACDSTMVLDAVATLRGEMLFFKDRYCKHVVHCSDT